MTEAEVATAYNGLQTAVTDGKEVLITIQSVLEASIAVNTVSEDSKDSYTVESWEIYAEALAAAEALNGVNDEDAVNLAVIKLAAAKDALVQEPEGVTDKTVMIQVIDGGPMETEAGKYTAETWAVFADALAKVAALQDKTGLTESEIDEAVQKLDDAYTGLVPAVVSVVDKDA